MWDPAVSRGVTSISQGNRRQEIVHGVVLFGKSSRPTYSSSSFNAVKESMANVVVSERDDAMALNCIKVSARKPRLRWSGIRASTIINSRFFKHPHVRKVVA
jgi:hypothetical protein